jgi:tetratricopeptide (TPR) repeat protein
VRLLLSRWDSACDGEGQLVYLAGEPGIGKSRVTHALLQEATAQRCTPIRYYCSPYHTGTALYPAVSQLIRAANFTADDDAPTKLEKLRTVVADAGRPDTDIPILGELLSVTFDAEQAVADRPARSADEFKAQTLRVLVGTLFGLARRKPVLFIVEDAQWIDPSTSELLTAAIESLSEHCVLLVITHRPEFVPPWKQLHATALSLTRLGRKQGERIVATLTGGKALPAELLEHILSKTDGVPLFVEELTKSILESDVLIDKGSHFALRGPLPEGAVPVTLQDSLMARLDRLGPTREIAQTAAVIGRVFSHQLMRAIVPLSEPELDVALDRLCSSELIYQRGTPPDATYTFKHALVQDAAYGSLLRRRREAIHERIATALREDLPELVAAQPELLAHHYTHAGNLPAALEAWLQAGRQAATRSANLEAVAHLHKGLDLLRQSPETPSRNEQELAFLLALFVPYTATRFWTSSETAAAYARAEELCSLLNRTEPLARILFGTFSSAIFSGDLESAATAGERLLVIGKEHQSNSTLMHAYRWLSWPALFRGQLQQVADYIARSLALYEAAKSAVWRSGAIVDPQSEALCIQAQQLWLSGFPDQSVQTTDRAVAGARAVGYSDGLAFTLIFADMIPGAFAGDAQRVATVGEEVLDLTQDSRSPFLRECVGVCLGWARAKRGQHEAGTQLLLDCMRNYRDGGGGAYVPLFCACLADIYIDSSDFDLALAAIDDAHAYAASSGMAFYSAELSRLRGVALRLRSDRNVTEAQDCLSKAVDIACAQGAQMLALKAATSWAEMLRDAGRHQEGKQILEPLYEQVSEGAATPMMRAARSLLDQ